MSGRAGFGFGMSLFAVVANPTTTSSPTGSGSDFNAGVYTTKKEINGDYSLFDNLHPDNSNDLSCQLLSSEELYGKLNTTQLSMLLRRFSAVSDSSRS